MDHDIPQLYISCTPIYSSDIFSHASLASVMGVRLQAAKLNISTWLTCFLYGVGTWTMLALCATIGFGGKCVKVTHGPDILLDPLAPVYRMTHMHAHIRTRTQ